MKVLVPRWLKATELPLLTGLPFKVAETEARPDRVSLAENESYQLPLSAGRLSNFKDLDVPSGNGVSARNLLRLSELTEAPKLVERSRRIVEAAGRRLSLAPSLFAGLGLAGAELLLDRRHLVVVGEPGSAETRTALSALARAFVPQASWTLKKLEGKGPGIYLCDGGRCSGPLKSEPVELEKNLGKAGEIAGS